MPRPRVRAEDRQRASKACLPCKASKKRCDSRVPCISCLRRNRVSECIYDERRPPRRRRPLHTDSSPSYLLRQPEAFGVNSIQDVSLSSQEQNQLNEVSSPKASDFEATVNDDQADSDEIGDADNEVNNNTRYEMPADERVTDESHMEVTAEPQSRLMLNAKGEKVYVGNAAALAFLQFLRQILSQHMGPSHFTENRRGNVMLEAQASGEDLPDSEEDADQKRILIDNYFLASGGILDICTRNEAYEYLVDTEPASDRKGLLYLILAIGGQCKVSSPLGLKHSQRYFTCGQQIAFLGMLENPSIELIHSFLLMAFYLFGACRRNAAFMYLGVAARAAHSLGLHESHQYCTLSRIEQSLRQRTWKSLRILDVMTSSILARPLASIYTRPDTSTSSLNGDQVFSQTAVNANFEMCSIIVDVLEHISQQTQLDYASAQSLLRRLSKWSTNLSPEMRLCSIRTSMSSSEHEQVLSNMHTTCLYYFTVMLLTRPFLIRYLMSRLEKVSKHDATTVEPSSLSDLAHVCIDVAVFMAQICHNALSVGLLIDNMCILKAWIFAAGLVLGFTLFANIEVGPEIENAFTGVRDVLKMLSQHSPQAEHYHDVLSSFFEAIIKRRNQIAQERRKATSQYAEQIFVIHVQNSQDGHHTIPTSGEADSIENWWNSGFPFAPGTLDDAPDITTANWDAFALQISENFAVDGELFRR